MGFTDEKRQPFTSVESTYRAFLLRCWREAGAGPNDPGPWRFGLLEPGGGETERAFASLEALLGHLCREFETEPEPGYQPGKRLEDVPLTPSIGYDGETPVAPNPGQDE